MTLEEKEIAQAEMYEQMAASCSDCMYSEKSITDMPCCACYGYDMFVSCEPYDEGVAKKYDGWFEEVCGVCQQTRIVHDDPHTNLGNPGFICSGCQEDRNRCEGMWGPGMTPKPVFKCSEVDMGDNYCYFLERIVNPVKGSCMGCPKQWVIDEGYYKQKKV